MTAKTRKELVTGQVAKAMWDVLTKLLSLLRWSSYIADERYNELNKQTLNAAITYILAIEAKEAGQKIDMTRFPKIIIQRMFTKLSLCDIREDFIETILKLGNIEREKFDAVIEKDIREMLGTDFAKFVQIDKEWEEVSIFQGATKLATRMEFEELKGVILKNDFVKGLCDIDECLNEYSNLSGFARISLEYSKEMTLFRQISNLRNLIRWQKWLGSVKCSVLGHSIEVAIFAYLIALKKYGDEEIATKCFFTGVFHDLPETFTGDMPSPIKDSIPGLRKATEYFEMEMVNKHIYSNLPPYLSEAMHQVMMEEVDLEKYKPLLKMADMLSADFECMRQIIAGSKEPYFAEVIKRDLGQKDRFCEPFYSMFKAISEDIL